MAERSPTDLALFARFRPSWDHIDPLRQCAELWIKTRAGSSTADKANIVVHELLENAIKYGDPASEIEFEVLIAPDATSFEVRVRNSAAPARVAILQKEFQRVAGDTASASFSRALQRLQKLPAGASMLGLSRVAMEAQLQLEVEQDRVTVKAHVDVVAGPGADVLTSRRP